VPIVQPWPFCGQNKGKQNDKRASLRHSFASNSEFCSPMTRAPNAQVMSRAQSAAKDRPPKWSPKWRHLS